MEVLGLIPARGGSKGIPRKNLVLLAGQPLLGYTCAAAHESKSLTRVVLSTDDEEIASVGQACGVDVPFRRPEAMGTDEATVLSVVTHALGWLRDVEGYRPAAVVCLQPTSPLRRALHIDEAVRLLEQERADTVVSVVEVPHQYNPLSVMTIQEGCLHPFLPAEGTRLLRRQDKPRVYARNGPAILVTRTEVLEQEGTLYGRRVVPYVMPAAASIDIDDRFDLEVAELILTTPYRSLPS